MNKFLSGFLLIFLCSNYAYSALSPDGMRHRNISQMIKMEGLFDTADTQDKFLVESFDMSELHLLFIRRIGAKANIISTTSGERKTLRYSAYESVMPGPQSGLTELEEGKEYFMRINCYKRWCKPQHYSFFNFSKEEYENEIKDAKQKLRPILTLP